MSVFGKLFGGKKGDKALTTGEAIQKLRETEEMLNKKQDFLEKKVDAETATARKNAKTNKRVALAALKRKKRYEKQLQQIDGTLTTIGKNSSLILPLDFVRNDFPFFRATERSFRRSEY